MRIAFITTEFVSESKNFDGGLANYLFRVSKALKNFGHQPIIFVLADNNEKIIYENIDVFRVQIKNTGWYNYLNNKTFGQHKFALQTANNSFLLNKAVLAEHRQKKIDIIQYASYLSTSFFHINCIPSVVRLSGYQKLFDMAYNQYSAYNIQTQHVEEIALKQAKYIFGPGKFEAQAISENFMKNVEIIESPYIKFEKTYLYNTVSFLKTNLKTSNYLLFFGTLGLLKGTKYIADILSELFSLEKNISFVFVGKDAGFNGKPMKDYIIEQTGIYSSRVFIFDRLTHEELFPIIENAYLVVLPSRIDNFPNTCIEAMAAKKIVIGTEGTSFEQLIVDGENGFLCKNNNPQNLLQTILKALKISDLQKRQMENKAFERIEKLKPEFVVNQLLEYYSEIIKKEHFRGFLPCGIASGMFKYLFPQIKERLIIKLKNLVKRV